jgi:hypothetical protein
MLATPEKGKAFSETSTRRTIVQALPRPGLSRVRLGRITVARPSHFPDRGLPARAHEIGVIISLYAVRPNRF